MLAPPMIPTEPGTLDVSVVVPVRDEAASLPQLVRELRAALDASGGSWEALFVDDASRDGSGALLGDLARADARLRVVRLARHGGQSAAIAAGLARAHGRAIVTLDADLQNDPADVPRLLAALARADVAHGIRTERRDGARRRLVSAIANAFRRALVGDSIRDIGCSLTAYRRDALAGLPAFVGVHRFLPALCERRGARIVQLAVAHRPRRHGRSKYGVADRLGRGIADVLGVRWLRSRLIAPAVAREAGRVADHEPVHEEAS